MLTRIVLWFLASVVLSLSATVEAKVVYVKTDGDDFHTGLSWDQAKLTVQEGLLTADVNDQVWVAMGTYNGCITLQAGVALYGGFIGNETTLSQRDFRTNLTILDGQNGGSVVTSPSEADNTTRIDGFTIKNGEGTDSGGDFYGGGIYCLSSSSPIIINNTINGNTATYGGGIYCSSSSSPIIINNTINENTATSGGGISCVTSFSTITNNIISGNYADSQGGGIYCYQSSPSVANNTISGNIAYYNGGGIYCFFSSPAIINNTISENHIYDAFGGGIYCSNSSPSVANNIIAFNDTGIYKVPGIDTPVFRNNCVFNPGGDNYTNLSAGTGDISLDPLFVDNATGNFHLTANSPCIDQGSDNDTQTSWVDMDNQTRIAGPHLDIGADEYPFTILADCDRNGQVTAADLAIIMGSMDLSFGQAGYWGKADLDSDGSITSTDLAIVLNNIE
ncbi:MAG: right-handed parallel beta-helix repeat-containing protein [Phycisphaerae bacterium]